MVMAFDLLTASSTTLVPQVDAIACTYFSIDTATPETAHAWYDKNPDVLIMAAKNNVVHGYADFLPLTSAALDLMLERNLMEEDIGPEHILAPEHLHLCRAVYFAGIAVRDKGSVSGSRCTAALVAGVAHRMTHTYRDIPLEYFLANPTTFSGNRLGKRMGLESVSFSKKTMRGMDLYMLTINPASRRTMQELYDRYRAHVGNIDWA